MTTGGDPGALTRLERVLVLAPLGRDGRLAERLLREAGMAAEICADLPELVREVERGAGLALITQEAVRTANLAPLSAWIAAQPPWSDLPLVVVTERGGGPERNPGALRLMEALGNVSLLERPFHPATLASVARTAMRSRRRQYQARAQLEELARRQIALQQAEGALLAHQERLEELVGERTDELAGALERLRAESAERERTEEALRQSQKMEAIGQLTGGIAHDFNNLLTGISGSMELMQTRLRQGRTGDLGRYISAAAESATRAAALTHRLLAFARRQTLELKQVDVNRLTAGMEELLRRTVDAGVTVEIVLAGGLWPTLCDGNQLESALLNLCINANDAMSQSGGPRGGRLTIETANAYLDDAYVATQPDLRPGQYVALSVTDTGTGMAPETAARVFDPFFTTKPLGQGTGLGLSMVYGFVKQSGGHIRIYSEEGHGTTVRMYLPRHIAKGETAATPAGAAAEQHQAKAGTTVLVVEDEPVVRALIVEALEGLGYSTLEAADGPAGLRVLQSGVAIHLVVTDVGLPGMNGRQMADAARLVRPALKVLFITGYAHNAAVGNHLLEAGMQMVAKPFALDALTAKVRAMMDA